jgi:hypothetical protein
MRQISFLQLHDPWMLQVVYDSALSPQKANELLLGRQLDRGHVGGVVIAVGFPHLTERAAPEHLLQHPDAERAIVRHDMSDLEQNRRVGGQIWDGLSYLRRQVDQLDRRPDGSALVMAQLERLLPAEGWLTDRLSRLRATARLLRRGHLARIDQLRKQAAKLSPTQRSQARQEIVSRYEELKLDVRLERLDRTVAATEKRIRDLTRQARRSLAAHEYAKVPNLLDEAVKLQGHNARLITLIERTEARLLALARRAARQSGEVSDE